MHPSEDRTWILGPPAGLQVTSSPFHARVGTCGHGRPCVAARGSRAPDLETRSIGGNWRPGRGLNLKPAGRAKKNGRRPDPGARASSGPLRPRSTKQPQLSTRGGAVNGAHSAVMLVTRREGESSRHRCGQSHCGDAPVAGFVLRAVPGSVRSESRRVSRRENLPVEIPIVRKAARRVPTQS